jgi:hypothetical protein
LNYIGDPLFYISELTFLVLTSRGLKTMNPHSIALLGPLPEIETTAFLPVAFRYSAVSPQPERGDLVKVDVIGDGESLKTYHRQVVSVTELPDERPPCMSVLLAPLDLPLMRQVEVTGRDGSPRVVWLASEAPLVPGGCSSRHEWDRGR